MKKIKYGLLCHITADVRWVIENNIKIEHPELFKAVSNKFYCNYPPIINQIRRKIA